MRLSPLRTRVGVISIGLVLTGALVGIGRDVASASTCVSWTGTQPVNPSSSGDQLTGVSVASPCDVWVVGSQQVGLATQTLTEHWNGLAWTAMPSSNPGGSSGTTWFNAVAVKSSTDAWAVGYYTNGTSPNQTLIELLSGGTWEQVSSPDPAGPTHPHFLQDVAIISAKNAWAVGDYESGTTLRTLIVHWNGATWSQVPSPNPSTRQNELFSVAFTSATNGWAVGTFRDSHDFRQTLIEHWNGTKWSRVPSPDPGGSTSDSGLSAVAARSASDAWAVGDYVNHAAEQALFLHWNGSEWKQVTSHSLDRASLPVMLSGVTVLSASNAWAVGTYIHSGNRTVAAHWNGTTLTLVPTPDPGPQFDVFSAVAASSPTDVWAVGIYNSTTGPNLTMAFHCC